MSSIFKDDELTKAIEKVKAKSPERRFKESIDLTIVFRGLDLKRDTSKRLSDKLELPHQFSPAKKVCIIGSAGFAYKAKEAGADKIITPEELKELSKNKRLLKKLAKEYDHFIAQADLVPTIARILGPILGPRGKIPTPVPIAATNLESIVNKMRKSVTLRMRNLPVLHVKVGSRDMDTKKIAENIKTVLDYLDKKYGGLRKYFEKAYLKTTMGPPVTIGERE
uniref:Large ribosomal subunit protein uL1 n=1 Tax=uncultured korarchaeote TaxID=161241 RepID=A0A1L2JQ61_9CREN|nr:ribosomal protein L1 [uncultured korarchaeote]